LVWVTVFPALAEQGSAQCPAVNCDCGAIADIKLKELCSSREAQVVSECAANQGKPKTFCGLHGPNASPVAISLQRQPASAVVDVRDVETVRQLITTQSWSLEESFKALNSREKSQQFGDAVQVLNLLERDSERLYSLHKQVLTSLHSAQRGSEAAEQGTVFATNTLAWARQLRAYGDQLWQKTQSADGERTIKAYRALALKSARLAAEIFEFGGDLYLNTGKTQESALAWQSAAEVAQSLIAWERAGDNKAQHVEFYQAQAAARWHRATFLWLESNNKEAIASTLERAASVGSKALAEYDPHTEQRDTHAIKRGSR